MTASTQLEPLRHLSWKIGPLVGAAATVISAVAGLGINPGSKGLLTRKRGLIDILAAVVPAVISGLASAGSAVLVAEQGRKLVTPVVGGPAWLEKRSAPGVSTPH